MASKSSKPPSAVNIPMTKMANSIIDDRNPDSVIRSRQAEKSIPKIAKGPISKEKRKLTKIRDRSPTASFSDGRPIDMVMAYKPLEVSRRKRGEYAKYRRKFENELRGLGFQLEYESKDLSRDGKTAYIKIHAPFDALGRQAELRRLRKPTHRCDLPSKITKKNVCSKFFDKIFTDPFRLQKDLQYPFTDYFTEPFRRKTRNNFVGSATDTFFTPAERAYLTYDIVKTVQVEIKRKKGFLARPLAEIGKISMDPNYKYGATNKHRPSVLPRLTSEQSEKPEMPATLKVGIDFLLEMNVYESVYALHDCDMDDEETYEKLKKKPVSKWPMRMYLYESWVNPTQLFRHQPLDAVRDYYGERVAFYFAFLGFYTKMLILPAIAGLLVLIYGGASVGQWDEMSKLACHDDHYRNFTICRDCPFEDCGFKHLGDFCRQAKASEVFDNEATTVFAIFTALWAVCFLALWGRYRSELSSRWYLQDHSDDNVQDVDDEPVRPEYEMTAPDRRRNPVTGKFEPYFDKYAKMRRTAASAVTVIFFILIVVALISSLMVYKIMGTYVWSLALGFDQPIDYISLTSVVGAIANGILIWIMSKIYHPVARLLTKAENHRTDSEFEQSYIYKVVIFECVNYYGALFYLAFIRGQMLPPPHEQGDFQDRCPVTGCLVDVFIQLAIIYSGKQILDSFFEIVVPLIRVCFNKVRGKLGKQGKSCRWEEDYRLHPTTKNLLFSDYLQLFIQYGFVTMFVPAFPLAPLFALVNNIVRCVLAQIRIDAYKLLVYTRRGAPIPIRREAIWIRIIRMMTKVAILTNALLISLTMEFIPKLIFTLGYGKDFTMIGYVDFILSEFNTTDWEDRSDELRQWPADDDENRTVDRCYYRDFRVSPWKPDPHGQETYGRTEHWWHVMVTRLAFIVVFEHFIFLAQSCIEYLIPPEPSHIAIRQKREEHLAREKFMEEEEKRQQTNQAHAD